MKDLELSIRSLLATKDELNRKQVALFLAQDKIDLLDYYVKELAKYSNGKVNRNILIEMAVDNILKVAPNIIKDYENKFKISDSDYDTIICPALDGGQAFLKNYNYWEYVKIDSSRLDKLKYLVLYIGHPHSKLMIYCKIDHFEEHYINNQKKYKIYVNKPFYSLDVPLGNASPLIMRNIKFTTLAKVKSAKTLKDIF